MSGEKPPELPVTPPSGEGEESSSENPENITDAEFTDINPNSEETVPSEQEISVSEADAAATEAVRARLGLEDAKTPAVETLSEEPESAEANETHEGAQEKPNEHLEDPSHKKSEGHTHKKKGHEKHGKQDSHAHGGGHHEKLTPKQIAIGVGAVTAGGAVLGAGLLMESAEVVGLLHLGPVVSTSLTGIGLGAGFLGIWYGLGSLGVLSFLGNFAGAFMEEIKKVKFGGFSLGGGGGGAKKSSGGGDHGGGHH